MPRDKIILLVAFTSGFLAFVLVFTQLSRASKPAYSVVVAAQELSQNTILAEEHLGVSKPMRNLNTQDMFLQPADTVGLELLEAVATGQPILRSNVKRPKPPVQAVVDVNGRAVAEIPAGMRVMELGAAEADKIPDLIQTGYFVDLFGYKDGAAADFRALVFSAPVLDVHRQEDNSVSGITIGLTLDEAEAVSSALKNGKLRLAVRTEAGVKPHEINSRMGSMEVIRGSSAPTVASFNVSGSSSGVPADVSSSPSDGEDAENE